MGAILSSHKNLVDSVVVEITPRFYDSFFSTITDVTYKTNALYKIPKDLQFMFGMNSSIEEHSIVNGKLIYRINLPYLRSIRRLRAYIKDAWWKYTNSGDPVRATFVKNELFFRVDLKDVKINAAD